MTIKVFTSRSCAPCQVYKTQLEGIPNVTYVDIDDPANVPEAIALNIMQVPTTVFSSGVIWTGVRSREEVLGML